MIDKMSASGGYLGITQIPSLINNEISSFANITSRVNNRG